MQMTKLQFTIKIFFFSLVLFFASSSVQHDKISAVVGKSIITESEVEARSILLKKIQNLHFLSKEQEIVVRQISLQSLIDEILMNQELKKHKITISDSEVEQFILNLETSRKLGVNFFKAQFGKDSLLYKTFFAKMRGESAKSRLVGDIIHSIQIPESEVEDLAHKYAKKDAKYKIRLFKTHNNSSSSYAKLNKILKIAPSCSKNYRDSDVEVSSLTKKSSEFSPREKSLVSEIREGDFSVISDDGVALSLYQVCQKRIDGISTDEFENISNVIGNKIIGLKFTKFIETIRKKTYIKIM
ncbi:MAG: SurA N-terminal domain-containing protein [Rickettsiaceae bacterium]|nr:SurA N-terminal domain-containing protein [Rickettsiaceae bacterium]